MAYEDLSPKRKRFIDLYLEYLDPRRAADDAGYAKEYGYALTQTLKAEIAERTSETSMASDEVLLRLADIARGNMGDFLTITDGQGRVDLDKATKLQKTHLISSIRETRYGLQITLYDAQRALDQLAKLLGLSRERIEFSSEDVKELAHKVVSVIDSLVDDPEVKSQLFRALGFTNDDDTS